MVRHGLLVAGAVAFCVLVLLNVGGYRYGVSDQAFYIPVVRQGLEPGLYPHDASLLAAQNRFFAFDNWFAPLVGLTGSAVPHAFLLVYLAGLLALYIAAVGVGRGLFKTWWAVAGFLVGLTLRHRIPDTAVNTMEAYFHPRLLAFAVGLAAVAIFLRGRTWPALLVAAAALLIHPTTALWFALWVGVAALVADRESRQPLVVTALLALVAAAVTLAGPLRSQLTVMDPVWVSVLAHKDYLLPSAWPPLTWFANLGLAAVIGAVYRYRHSLGLTSRHERGLVVGCGVLLLMFLVSVPLAAAHVALAVQLQLSRIFWLLDTVALAYAAWVLIESPLWSTARPTARRAVVATVVIASLGRGGYVTWVERSGEPLVRTELAATDWTRVMRWASDRPVGTHLLADPGHAWRYGSSVRVASGRDVYLEEIKDIGIAIYSRDVAHRVARRIDNLGDFATLDASRARALAVQYDLDYLVTEHPVDLPRVHQDGRFTVYDLRTDDRLAASAVRRGANVLSP